MKLNDFLNKDVVITDISGKEWLGFVYSFHSALDNEEGEASITLQISKADNVVVEFMQSEIRTIQVA